jgi:hypothetical protein
MGAILDSMPRPTETRVFDGLTVVYHLEEDPFDWEAARSALFGLTVSDKELRGLLGDLYEVRRHFELAGSGAPEDSFLISNAGNMTLYVLPVPDPVVDADAHWLDGALKRLEAADALGEANLFLTKPSKPRRSTARRARRRS